jgi:hypothetical protein
MIEGLQPDADVLRVHIVLSRSAAEPFLPVRR